MGAFANRMVRCSDYALWTAATERHDTENKDDQSEQKNADPSEAAHSVAHPPYPAATHHAATALTWPLTENLCLGTGREAQKRKRRDGEQTRRIAKD
jgi:hypothetical protein